MDLPKTYNFAEVERKWYRIWEERGYFRADPQDTQRPRFTIMMPPPNVTGIIHMGHVLDNTLQDILARWKRMQGYNVLWQPGTDHAGIATQNVVERQLAREGKTRFDVGREKFVRRVWQWKEEYGNRIIQQLKRLGASADWSRSKFTMDPDMYRAVIEAFVRLYEEGLIYRGLRIINWCPRCGTALADDEVEHQEHDGHLWYLRYPLADDPDTFVVVATTRPETYLGDTAVAVHPDDERYRHLVGKKVRLPLVTWTRRAYAVGKEPAQEVPPEIPIIADPRVDPEFGTGAVKVTPAHDPNDYDIGTEHGLPFVLVMDKEARMNENAGPYAGLDRYEARKRIVEDLQKAGFLEKTEPHRHAVGHCYRCKTVIEPYLSEQWFVKMRPLAEPALQVVREGRLRIIPKRFEKVYFNWLENVRDWCISRQIWWGHRVPVYYCRDCGAQTVARQNPGTCPRCGSSNLQQDEDVLDTWFSSWLWPFYTLGWPDETPWLKRFYPTDVLVTGWDILFFWVARMVMAGLHFMGEVPFRDVYLHGLVRDEQRRKISKTLGNFVDPMEYMNQYGADALRISVILSMPEGQDILFGEKRIEVGRNFANKIWNASRLLLLNAEGFVFRGLPEPLELEDRWILTRLNETVEGVTRDLANYEFHRVARTLYEFFWHEFCDWYLEAIKPRLADERRDGALAVAFFVLERTLRLLHPLMPFITEEIWQRLPNRDGESIMIAPWPEPTEHRFPEEAEAFELFREVVRQIREARAYYRIPKKEPLALVVRRARPEVVQAFQKLLPIFRHLAQVHRIEVEGEAPHPATVIVVKGEEFYLPLPGIDLERERRRLQEEIQRVQELLEQARARLNNPRFLERAPEHVVAQQREKVQTLQEKLTKLQENLERLQ